MLSEVSFLQSPRGYKKIFVCLFTFLIFLASFYVHFLQHHDDVRKKNVIVYYETHSTFHPPITAAIHRTKNQLQAVHVLQSHRINQKTCTWHIFFARNKNSKIHRKKKKLLKKEL